MCFKIVFSCCESCTRDPRKLYDIGMENKKKYEEHPLYMREKQGILVSNDQEYKTYITYFNNIKYYLEASAKKGYPKAEFEFGRWSLEKCNGLYGGQDYIENAASKGHKEAEQWLLNKKQTKEHTSKIISLTFATRDDRDLQLCGSNRSLCNI